MVLPDSRRVSRVPRYSGVKSRVWNFLFTGLSPSLVGCSKTLQLSSRFLTLRLFCRTNRFDPSTPFLQRLQAYIEMVWAVPRSLAATGGITDLFSFPGGTEMVHFPPFAFYTYEFSAEWTGYSPVRVAPFGYLRVKACSRLTAAFRSLPRPSSPLNAKAFTVCP